MKKLFIIGNGFDQMHKLACTFGDFKKFISMNCGEIKNDNPKNFFNEGFELCYSKINIEEKGEKLYGSPFLYYFVGNVIKYCPENCAWKEFLAWLNDTKFIDTIIRFYKNYLLDNKDYYSLTSDEDAEQKIIDTLSKFPCFLNETIKERANTLKVPASMNNEFRELISNDTIFINFNYSLILEKTYLIKKENILHLYGSVLDNNIIFGDFEKQNSLCYKTKCNKMEICESLKNDNDIVKKRIDDFLQLNESNEIYDIYILGNVLEDFSIGNLRHVISYCNNKKIIYLNKNLNNDFAKSTKELRLNEVKVSDFNLKISN